MANVMNSGTSLVATLPPTAGVKDSATRGWLDAMANILDARSGNTNKDHPQRFITAQEFQSLSNQAMLRAFGVAGSVGFPPGVPGLPGSNGEAIDNLADLLRKSLVAQLLSQHIELIDINPIRERINSILNKLDGLDEGILRVETLVKEGDTAIYNKIDQIVLRIATAEGLIVNETNLRVAADQALFSQLEAVRLRVGQAEGAILEETTLRVTADQALFNSIEAVKLRVGTSEGAITNEQMIRVTEVQAIAKAVATIWASVGGATGVIQTGSNVGATPNAVEATQWNQVQAAVKDPLTGKPNATSIVTDVKAVADQTNNKFSSIYTVRAQVDIQGRKVVGGFGLAATASNNPAEGPTIDFGVAADRFFITSTTSTGSAADQEARGSQYPFIVLTRDEVVNGVVYHPGVYMKSVVIGDASIDTAKIKDLAVDTLKIRGEAITVPRGASASGTIPIGSYQAVMLLSTPALDVASSSVFVSGDVSSSPGFYFQGDSEVYVWPELYVLRDGGIIFGPITATGAASFSYVDTPGPGAHVYSLYGFYNGFLVQPAGIGARTIAAIGCKR